MTEIIKNISTVVEALKNGMVVALPTETVYGLAACINHENALLKIFELKKRPQDNPLIVHCLDLEMVEKIAYISGDFLKLYHHFMPGPLTVLLNKKNVSDLITRGQPTVGVRIPAHPLFLEVLKELKTPIAAPSANLSGYPSSTEALHVYHDFHPNLPFILDGGASNCGLESTIVSLGEDHAVILRPGIITKQELEKVLEKPVIYAQKNAPLQAPGMKYRHYAPQAQVFLQNSCNLNQADDHTLYMSIEPLKVKYWQKLSEDNLYKAFRLADEMGLKKIIILKDPNLSVAILNRIEKATNQCGQALDQQFLK